MLNNTDKVRVENRSNAIVGYSIPESNIKRRFVANEVKEISMEELRQAVQIPGTYRTILDNLIIHDKTAVEELLPGVEPEYFYTAKDVDFLLERGSLDQLRDALDFAPSGVIDLIKERAVKTELNDIRKRDIILEQTNFNITEAIKINHLSQEDDEPVVKVRRVTEAGAEGDSSVNTGRRASTPVKYSVGTK